MARGSKKKYTSKQKRKASKIESGYKKRGVSSKEAERRDWATVNKSDKGGRKKGGGGRGKKRSKSSSRKGGRKGSKGPRKLCHSAQFMCLPYFQFSVIMTYIGKPIQK